MVRRARGLWIKRVMRPSISLGAPVIAAVCAFAFAYRQRHRRGATMLLKTSGAAVEKTLDGKLYIKVYVRRAERDTVAPPSLGIANWGL